MTNQFQNCHKNPSKIFKGIADGLEFQSGTGEISQIQRECSKVVGTIPLHYCCDFVPIHGEKTKLEIVLN